MTLKISISGIRGITGSSLTDEVTSDFSKAFATYIGRGKVVIGRDPRSSGEKMKDIVISRLNELGIDAVYLGICPTPTVQLMVKQLKADGGLVITASHNPWEWNGLKFVRADGIFLNELQAGKLISIYESKKFKAGGGKGKLTLFDGPFDAHINKVIDCVNAEAIRKRKFRVVLDSCNGAGSLIATRLLKELGCEVTGLNTDITRPFPHDPEPVPENLGGLCEEVKRAKADMGFAQDADADRLAIVTEKGVAPGEEYTLAIAVERMLSKAGKNKNVVVTNLSTSRMIDDIASKYGASVIRTRIGEVNVAEKMVLEKSIIGGEGNGGVMHPQVGYNRDSLIGMGMILDHLAATGRRLSSVIDGLPRYFIVKRKMECSTREDSDKFIKNVKCRFLNEELDLTEGLKVILKDSWVHIRPSNTEPAIRVIAEAKSREEALKLIDKAVKG